MPRIAYTLDHADLHWQAVRAQGAGGQNVNKVSNAAHLRVDVHAAALPDALKTRVLALRDSRVSTDGVINIKAQQHRSLEKNRAEALARLHELLDTAAYVAPMRRATKPTRTSRRKRVESKIKRGEVKALRGPVRD
ncbi:MAG: aminoacyl-tRNA hydrolase [Burkholderiales bacterium]|jgi:ribosome-associated protein|nr:aminoacyl-tRNA hydrolase [Burkholderiales bacterium]